MKTEEIINYTVEDDLADSQIRARERMERAKAERVGGKNIVIQLLRREKENVVERISFETGE